MSNLNKNTEELEELLQIANDLPNAGSGDVIPGEDGGYYVPSISQPNADTMQVSFTPSKSDMIDITPKNITLPKGDTGVGITSVEQIVTSSEDGGTNLIKVTLSDGTSSQFPIRNGSKGSKGDKPTIEATETTDGIVLIIDGDEDNQFFLPFGRDGENIESIEQTKTSDVSDGENEITITTDVGREFKFIIKNGSQGDKGDVGTGIASIEQTTTSTEDDGNNVFTVTLTNGETATFTVQNGSKGNSGVYVGSGTPLNGENVQIDPSAEEELIIPDVLQTTGNSEVDTMSQKAITEALQNIGGQGAGENGATFTPLVSSEGVISWTNDKGLSNPAPVNIKGKTPEKGTDYFTEADKQELVTMVLGALPIAEEASF